MKRIKKYSSTDTSKTRKHVIASIKKMSRKWGMFIKRYPLQVTRMMNTERIKAFAKLHLTNLNHKNPFNAKKGSVDTANLKPLGYFM